MKEALDQLTRVSILVVGDLMADRYQWGQAERISPEAPVPVVRISREEVRLGGAANVAANLAALGCRVGVCGVVGQDAAGQALRGLLLDLGVDCTGLVTEPGRPTTEKLRIMAHEQQMLRVDQEQTGALVPETSAKLREFVQSQGQRYDGVIVSDYAKGVVSAELVAVLTALGKGRPNGWPVVVDPKGLDYRKYRGAACITPNEQEAAAAAGHPIQSDADALAAARSLSEQTGLPGVCITRGAKGVLAWERGAHRFFPAQARQVYDVTGAGDTFIAAFAGLLAAGRPLFEAAEIANLAASVAVGKLGTATVTVPELLSHSGGPRKLFGAGEIGAAAQALREQGKRVVFTNGCFDLLHAGHIQYLQDSRVLGDVLIVGVNSDASVKRLKGPSRPLIGEEDRAHLLAALACVDYVVIFDQDTPLELIRAIRPQVLTKGADYTVETVVGHDLLGEWGGEVRLIALKENRSTSGLIERIVATQR